MARLSPRVLRDVQQTWFCNGEFWEFLGPLPAEVARAFAERVGVQFVQTCPRTQAQFAHDVALERFGHNPAKSGGVWGSASYGVPIWARF